MDNMSYLSVNIAKKIKYLSLLNDRYWYQRDNKGVMVRMPMSSPITFTPLLS